MTLLCKSRPINEILGGAYEVHTEYIQNTHADIDMNTYIISMNEKTTVVVIKNSGLPLKLFTWHMVH